jgi:predicted DNA-binding WGR domain protein
VQRWELIGDGSAKFWEAAVEGACVSVRYGRIGTEGRTLTKELDSAAAATAQFGKLVAEKERKGYLGVGLSEPAVDLPPRQAADPAPRTGGVQPEAGGRPDEDTFVMPSSWRRLLHPRRGGAPRTVAAVRPEAVDRAQARIGSELDWLEQMLTDGHAHPTLVRAARAYLAGEADPLGAAVLANALPPAWRSRGPEESPFVDAWTASHGLVFAARAVVEVFEVEAGWQQSGAVRRDPVLRFRGSGHASVYATRPLADRARALLADADDQTYQRAVAALEACRTTSRRRAVAAYLAPGTPGWADECVDEESEYGGDGYLLRSMLLCALDDSGQVARLGPAPQLGWNGWSVGLIATLADGLGTDCAPLLNEAIDKAYGSEQLRSITAAVAQVPTDETFKFLLARLDDKHVRPALQEAVQRYPVRAMRLLAEAARKDGKNVPAARQILNSHVTLNSALLPALLPQLDEATAELVRSLDGARERVAEAAPEALPPLLVSPPWTRKRAPRKVRVLTGLQADDTSQVVWRAGEREVWAGHESWGYEYPESTDWDQKAAEVLGSARGNLWYAVRLLAQGPVDVLTPWLERWRPEDLWGGQDFLKPVVARYGMAALPMAVAVAVANPANLAPLLLPFLDLGAVRVMADGLVRLKSVQLTARAWFARHGVAAGLLLVPDAVGENGAARRAAEQALRLVAAAEGTAVVLAAVSERYGDEAAGVVAEALATDPLENALPARMPVLPVWVQPALLPQILLTSGEALPEDAVRHVLTMLALSKPADPYPGLTVVTELCRADTLAAFAWALFEEWRQAAMPAKESWILHALGALGDDETVRRLTPILRDWPGQGAHHRAVEGLNVLAEIGSDVALLHLHGIAQRVKFKALKVRAQEKIAEVAEGLGLTGDQLSDRLVPDLGLEPDGTTVIDYGPRRFTVGFDEQLRPFVLDADGKRRKDLPAPGAKDDQELAPAERKRFVALKKDVRTIASDQIRRLEAAMVAQRSWSAAEFQELFVQHPLVWHLVRRLVWFADAADGGPTTAFRVAEDRSFADVNDDGFTLADDATVRLAHPLLLGGAVAQWSELCADYEILQPFPQLGRPVCQLLPEEQTANRLLRFEGCTVPVGRLLGLTKRGWERGQPQDAGVERWFSKKLADGQYLVIALEMGIAVGLVNEFPDQTFETVWLDTQPGDHWSSRGYPLRFSDLDVVAVSELLADLEEVTAK